MSLSKKSSYFIMAVLNPIASVQKKANSDVMVGKGYVKAQVETGVISDVFTSQRLAAITRASRDKGGSSLSLSEGVRP